MLGPVRTSPEEQLRVTTSPSSDTFSEAHYQHSTIQARRSTVDCNNMYKVVCNDNKFNVVAY